MSLFTHLGSQSRSHRRVSWRPELAEEKTVVAEEKSEASSGSGDDGPITEETPFGAQMSVFTLSAESETQGDQETPFGAQVSVYTLAAQSEIQDDQDESRSDTSQKLDSEPAQDVEATSRGSVSSNYSNGDFSFGVASFRQEVYRPRPTIEIPSSIAEDAVAVSCDGDDATDVDIDIKVTLDDMALRTQHEDEIASRGSQELEKLSIQVEEASEKSFASRMEASLKTQQSEDTARELPEEADDASEVSLAERSTQGEQAQQDRQSARGSIDTQEYDEIASRRSSSMIPECELDAETLDGDSAARGDEFDSGEIPEAVESADDSSSEGLPPRADSTGMYEFGNGYVPEFCLRVESLARMGTPLLRTARPFFQRDPVDKKARLTFAKMEGVIGGKLPTWSGNLRLPHGAQELVAWRRVWTMKEAASQLAKLKAQHERLLTLSDAETQKKRKEVHEVTEQLVNAKLDDATLDKLSSNVQCAADALEEAQDHALIYSKFTSTQLAKSQQEARCFKDALADIGDADGDPGWVGRFRYCSDLGWEPQCTRFCEILLERQSWRPYPRQSSCTESSEIAYQGRAGRCKGSRPMGGAIVDFADDPQHALTAMTIQGRHWLEEKHKLAMLFSEADWCPHSYFICDGVWKGRVPSESESSCWFMKSTGSGCRRGVNIMATSAECLSLAATSRQAYIVQPHIEEPMLLGDKKFHLKLYMCPIARAVQQGATPVWEVWAAKEGYICEAKEAWSASQLTLASQTTTNQTKPASYWPGFNQTRPKCIAIIVALMKRMVKRQHLRSVPGRATFEMFAVDFLVDTCWKVWLLGCDCYSNREVGRFDDTCMVRDLLNLAVPESRGDSLFSILRRTEQFQSWEFITCIEEPPAPKEKVNFSAALAHLYRP